MLRAIRRPENRGEHSALEMGNLLMLQERERFLVKQFRRRGIGSLEDLRIFEAGCSAGYNLRLMVQWGARPEHVVGMEIDPEQAEYVARRSSQIRVHVGSADNIPEEDKTFELAMAFTLFSSVTDEDVAHGIAREMFRITKPGGLIVVYDMRRRSRNPRVHPVDVEDVRRWFPKCPMRMYPITLGPPLARLVGRYAPWLYGPLAAIPPLRTHAMYVLRRPATSPFDEGA